MPSVISVVKALLKNLNTGDTEGMETHELRLKFEPRGGQAVEPLPECAVDGDNDDRHYHRGRQKDR